MKIRRTLVSLLICALLIMLLMPSCSTKKEPETYTGIISAMSNEVSLLLEETDVERVDTIGGVEYNVGKLRGENVVIAQAGIGKVMSSSGVTAMLNNYPISKVIFTGIAGGVGDETQVLDEVIATRLVQHDFGMTTDEGFKWYEGNDGFTQYFECDEDLVNMAYDAAVAVVGEDHAFKGTIATGDQFIASEQYVDILQKDFDALACEMEGAAIGMVCTQYDTPFVVIRAMSDKADGKAHETYDNMADIAADNSSKILIQMLENGQKE